MRLRKLRSWRAANTPEIRFLDCVCFPTDIPFLTQEGCHWWVLRDGEKLVGYAGVWVDKGRSQLTRCGIRKSYRGRGLGKILVNAAARWSRRQGLKSMVSYTSIDNIASKKNLIGCGFSCRRDWSGKWLLYRLGLKGD